MEPLGYMMFRVQIPYMPSYDEDQVALLVVEGSSFLKKCQVMLGTPTINRAIRAMKESEMENAPEAWQSAQHTYEFANYMVQLNPEDYGIPMPTNMGENPTDLDKLVLLKNKATIPAFKSIILHCRTRRTIMMGYKLHVMTQAPYPEDRANLPNGVYVVKPSLSSEMAVVMCWLSSIILRANWYICLPGGQWPGLWPQMPFPMPLPPWSS